MRKSASRRLDGATVLVTGGAGFIGSHLVTELLSFGAKVRILDNLATGRSENLSQVCGRIEFIHADIRQFDDCLKACLGSDYVVHLAALGSVPRSIEVPEQTFSTNVMGTANVFTAARDASVKRVVYASSAAVYGANEDARKREGAEGKVLSPYALSKRMCEELAATYVHCYQMQIMGLRYFNVYGPRQDPTGAYAAVVPRFFTACRQGLPPVIQGNGEQTRDFTYVSDVVEATLAALAGTGHAGAVFNVGAGIGTTINEVAAVIARTTRYVGTLQYGEPRSSDIQHSVADPSGIQQALGWTASTSLVDGIGRCAEYY